jgi:hypothetical protein
MTQAQLADKSPAELLAIIAALQANQAKPRSITFKVTAKKEDGSGTDGAISAYGLGRFPVTLYRGQWERLIEAVPALQAFIEANAAILSVKS